MCDKCHNSNGYSRQANAAIRGLHAELLSADDAYHAVWDRWQAAKLDAEKAWAIVDVLINQKGM